MTVRKILIIDPDNAFRGKLSHFFRSQNIFDVWDFPCGSEGILAEKQNAFDIFICDSRLETPSTIQFLSAVKDLNSKSPFVILTNENSDTEAVFAFENGATDYLSKDTTLSVLRARVDAHLRTYERSDDAPFDFGSYRFRPSSRKLMRKGSSTFVHLPEKEADILKFLNRAPGRWASTQRLLDEVWGYGSGVCTHTVQTHVWRLRRKIEPRPNQPIFVITENRGYRLVADTN